MKQVIIGSVAIKHHFKDFDREIHDLDIATDVDNIKRDKLTEYLYNPIIFKYIDGEKYLRPEYLLSLKMSHISWNINFKKHMYDIQFLLDKGVKYDIQLYNELLEY